MGANGFSRKATSFSIPQGKTFRFVPIAKTAAAGILASTGSAEALHAFIVWAAAAFGNHPINNLIGVGDVAGLAVDAVGKVDFEPHTISFLGHLIDGRGTKILAGIAVLFNTAGNTDVGVENVQVTRLVVVVARPRVIHVGQPVTRQPAVSFETFFARSTLLRIQLPVVFVTRLGAHGVDQTASARNLLERRVYKPAQHAMLKRLMEVAHLPQLIADITLFHSFLKSAENLGRRVARLECLEYRFGGKHAALHRQVNA